MTLAGELLKDATAARKTWSERQTERFAKACQKRVRDSQGFETSASLKVLAPAQTRQGAQKAAQELKRSLDAHGFAASDVQVEALAKGMIFRLSVQASWVRDEPQKTETGGFRGQCPVCLGSKVLVALAPCGHTVCHQCKGKLPAGRKCPMCRSVVERVTAGIFVS
ncbi:BIRC3 [Symbiodinium natans]|uniref:BIRC3 protein n=1 Tax=Symbiodinium natans TaxID=878477 RepID=A0A812UQD1_9DINO|nr:BIRC3 [Symbiodinium natans]